MRRLLAACGAAALSLAVVIPLAHADPADNSHKMNWWTPYDQQGNIQPQTAPDYRDPSGAPVSGTSQVVTVRVDFPDGVKGWQVILQPEAGGTPSTCAENFVPSQSGGAYPNHVYISCPWDTTRAVDRTLDQPTPASQAPDMYHYDHNWHLNDHGASANGKYAIQVKAWSAAQSCLIGCTYGTSIEYDLFQDYTATPQRWREVYVTNGIADPTGVAAGYDAGSGKVNVTWAPNPEPDVTYLVQEKVGDGSWAPIGTVPASATNYVRSIAQPGKYQYQVAATRPAPTGDNSSATVTSKYVAAQAVTVSAVSPPTTGATGSAAPGAPAAGAPDGANGFIDHSGDNGVTTTSGPQPTATPGSHVPDSAKGTPAAAHSTGSKAKSGGAAAAGGEDEGEGPDTGFSSTLPYQDQNGATDGLGSGNEESPESMSKLVNVPRPQGTRALLIPLAGALAMFVLAAQGMYLLRRRAPITAGGLAVDDDFDDWMGY
jgi:hypothetical protein